MRALIVTYNFPPVTSAGVWRTLKLVKYLPEHGVQPAVLTVSNASVPMRDESLLEEVDPSVEILRARTFEPGYGLKSAVWKGSAEAGAPGLATRMRSAAVAVAKGALFPDPQVLWVPHASVILAKRLRQRRDDVVFISAPPFSQLLIGLVAAALPRTALVFDYRDEWSTYRESYEMMGGLGETLGPGLERWLLGRAQAITTATEAFRENLLSQFPLDPERVVTISNGYDRSDLPGPEFVPPTDRFRITYAGTVFKLTRPVGFLRALRLFRERSPELASVLEVCFAGRVVATEEHLFEEELGIRRLGVMSKAEVMALQAQSHLVLCTLDEEPGSERIYPGKIFELMALARPILTLAPKGALSELVLRHEAGSWLAPRDEVAICEFLERQLRAFNSGNYRFQRPASGIEIYDRRRQAAQFRDVFQQAMARV